MGRLFKPRRKSTAQTCLSEAASVVKDLSDMVNSQCPNTELVSPLGLSSPGNQGSPPHTTTVAQLTQNCGQWLGFKTKENPEDLVTPCQCHRCSRQSAGKAFCWPYRRRDVQVMQLHLHDPENNITNRSVKDELYIAMTVCMSSCICAHLISDTLIGLERFRWLEGLTKTLRISFILYVVLRLHARVIALASTIKELILRFLSMVVNICNTTTHSIFAGAGSASPSNFARSPSKGIIRFMKHESISSAPPTVVWAAEEGIRELSTQLPQQRTSSSSHSEFDKTVQIGKGDELSSWDLEVPAEGLAGRVQCHIRGKIRLTELK